MMKKIACITFTRHGTILAEEIRAGLDGEVEILTKETYRSALPRIFETCDGIVFIASAGIAVRLCAPFLQDKAHDPAIVVVDDLGRYAISLLSGHLGGANALTQEIASLVNLFLQSSALQWAVSVAGVFVFAGLTAWDTQRLKNEYVYGAMDGAGKFVAGDVNAGIFITFINIVGGIFIGVLQKDMGWMEAAQTFSLLTIGDGLVSTIPSLITSTSAGLIVSRAASEARMGEEFIGQLTNHPKALRLVSGVLLLFAIVPGMPTVAFMILSGALFLVAMFSDRIKAENKEPETGKKKKGGAPDSPEEVQALLPLDVMELEVGYGLIPLVDEDQNGNLLARIRSIRRQFALDMGVIVPSLHLRDNLQLKPGEYVVQIKGNRVASAEIMIDHFLAMDPGDARHAIKGIETLEPAFNLPALWIPDAKKDEAVMAGYTVVDPSTVIATHLTEVFKQNLHEFLGRQEVQALLDNLSQRAPKVVEELVPGTLSLGTVQKVLQNLVRENVSIRDLLSIVECLADYGHSMKDADQLTEFVRQRLARTIIKPYLGSGNLLPIISLAPAIENTFQESIKRTDNGSYLAMEPGLAHKIIQAINKAAEKGIVAEGQPVLLTSPLIRQHLSQLLARFLPTMPVISQAEIPADIRLESVAMVEI